MIICYCNKNKNIIKILSGTNSIPPYSDEISYFEIENPNGLLFSKKDKVEIKENSIKIGIHEFELHKTKITIIDDDNCNKPILLEELLGD